MGSTLSCDCLAAGDQYRDFKYRDTMSRSGVAVSPEKFVVCSESDLQKIRLIAGYLENAGQSTPHGPPMLSTPITPMGPMSPVAPTNPGHVVGYPVYVMTFLFPYISCDDANHHRLCIF